VITFPQEFSASAEARVEAERLKASRDFDQYRSGMKPRPPRQASSGPRVGPTRRAWTDEETDLHEYIRRVFLAFAREALKLGDHGRWTVNQIRAESVEFLRRFSIEAYYERGFEKSGRPLSEMTSHYDGSLLPEVKRTFQESPEWQEFETALLAVAEQQAAAEQFERKGEPGTVVHFHELPPPFQDRFEAAKAKAELEYATRAESFPNHPQIANSALHLSVLIHRVFFAFCAEARSACRAGKWSVGTVSQAVDLAWPRICDFYCVREQGGWTEEQGTRNRALLWRTVTDDPQWKRHLSEVAQLATAVPTEEVPQKAVDLQRSDEVPQTPVPSQREIESGDLRPIWKWRHGSQRSSRGSHLMGTGVRNGRMCARRWTQKKSRFQRSGAAKSLPTPAGRIASKGLWPSKPSNIDLN
jgi:hypothetical protein